MEKVHFRTSINAPKEKVWDILWSDASYKKWTSVFCEDSYAESDWNEGSKILFLDGKGDGMVSKIAVKKPNELMSFAHQGEVKNRVEDTESESGKSWAGSTENYLLKEVDGQTELIVDIDVVESFKDYFVNTFPKALEQVKLLAESN